MILKFVIFIYNQYFFHLENILSLKSDYSLFHILVIDTILLLKNSSQNITNKLDLFTLEIDFKYL